MTNAHLQPTPIAYPAVSPFHRSGDLLSGHLWTILPAVQTGLLSSYRLPDAQPFRAVVSDPVAGQVQLNGMYVDQVESDTLIVIIHGLAGDASSPYVQIAARAAVQHGVSVLCLSMRGADGSGEDIFHGGLTADIRAALGSRELTRYKRVQLIGFSVGGHLALKAALDQVDDRLAAVAAICPPLDLDLATIAFDHPSCSLYRRHVFAHANRRYERAAERRKFLTPASLVRGKHVFAASGTPSP